MTVNELISLFCSQNSLFRSLCFTSSYILCKWQYKHWMIGSQGTRHPRHLSPRTSLCIPTGRLRLTSPGFLVFPKRLQNKRQYLAVTHTFQAYMAKLTNSIHTNTYIKGFPTDGPIISMFNMLR